MNFYERGLKPRSVVFGSLDLSLYIIGIELINEPNFVLLLKGFEGRFREDLYLLYQRSGSYFQPLFIFDKGYIVSFNSYNQDIPIPHSLIAYSTTRLEGQIMGKNRHAHRYERLYERGRR